LLGGTAEALRANIDWKSSLSLQPCQLDPNFQAEGVAPTNHSSSQETRLNDHSYGIKIWTDLSSVLSLTMYAFDRWTNGQTDTFLIASPCWHSIQCRKNEFNLQRCWLISWKEFNRVVGKKDCFHPSHAYAVSTKPTVQLHHIFLPKTWMKWLSWHCKLR